MHLVFYKSALCPRCAAAKKSLQALIADNPAINVEEIDILTAPLRTWGDGIRMIPALRHGERVLSGLLLTREAIAAFLLAGNTPQP